MSSSKHTALAIAMLCLLNAPLDAATAPQDAPPRATLPPADSFDKNLAVFVEVLGRVRDSYVDEPDMWTLTAGALEGATDALDPFSIYVPPAELDRYLEARKVGWEHSGVVVLKEHGIVYVTAVEEEGPGWKVGIRPGDVIARMDDRPTRSMPLWHVQELLAGKPGTRIDLELARDGQGARFRSSCGPSHLLLRRFRRDWGRRCCASRPSTLQRHQR